MWHHMLFTPSLCHKLSHLLGPPPPRARRTLWTAPYICYNRMLNITLNFIFHMYDKKIYKCDITSSFPLTPPVTNCHTFSDPSPLERDVLYGLPLGLTLICIYMHVYLHTVC